MSSQAPTSNPASAPASSPSSPASPSAGPAGVDRLPDVEGLPDGAREVSPLFVMLLGIAIPVALVAVAASGGSTLVLILALIAMVVVGFVTMVFMVRITSDPEHPHDAFDDTEH